MNNDIIQNIITITKIVITVLLIVIVIQFFRKPNLVKRIMGLYPTYEYKVSNMAHETANYTLYHRAENKKLVIVFNGGAFLFSNRRCIYGLLNYMFDDLHLSDTMDIVVFDYPVRFNYSVYESMLAINRVLKNFVGQYETFYGFGFSAGTLLLGTFIAKESTKETSVKLNIPQIGIKIKCFVGINGVYSTVFDWNLQNKLFAYYIMNDTPSSNLYTCYNLSGVPKLIISNKFDFLSKQTEKFLQSESADSVIYTNKNLPHNFVSLINLTETKDTAYRIVDFLLKQTT